MSEVRTNENVRFEADEKPAPAVALDVGIQAALVTLAPIALTVVFVVRIAGQGEDYLKWAVFAALLISGITTVLQTVRIGRIGSGHVLIMGTSGVFITVCIVALAQGGPSTMASLIVVSLLFQFALASRLSLLRRIFTPVVSGTAIMLIAATVMPIVFDTFTNVPANSSPVAGPLAAVVTLAVMVGLVLRAPMRLGLWAPLIGIAAGCIAAFPFGLYNLQEVVDAPWIGVPWGSWPGFNFVPNADFLALLLAFVVATLVGAIETIGDGVAIQAVSQRKPQATDFRAVQGALNADGVGNLLSGLAGTLPNTTYSSSVSLTEVTGVASKRVGDVIGVTFAILAFSPKVAALLIAIPGPIAAAYVIVLLGLLFVQGMRIVIQDGIDHRKAAMVGISFWVGVGFQNQAIFPDIFAEGLLGLLFGNGMTAGAIFAIVMMVFMEVTGPRRKRLDTALDIGALAKIESFLRDCAARASWNDASRERLTAAGEETLQVLLQDNDQAEVPQVRRMVIAARMVGLSAELEFVTSLEGTNMEDHLAYLGDRSPVPDEREVSFRLLRHHASSVRHQKYHGVDIVTVRVEGQR